MNNPPPSTANQLTRHIMVLLVDDQAIVASAVRNCLAGEPDIDFHYCSTPEDAVPMVLRIQPTVILQDLIMPELDGLSLVRLYRSTLEIQDIPIIVLSARDDPKIKSEAFKAGANDYMVKLPDKLELLARIRYHSRVRILQMQHDEAFRALRESQQKLLELNMALTEAASQIKQLQGLLPICSYCKKIRDDQNYWREIEKYLSQHTEIIFSHGVCPDCYEKIVAPQLRELRTQLHNVKDNSS